MLLECREKVIEIALKAQKHDLMQLTLGNFSIKDGGTGYICITPSGIKYEHLRAEDITVIDEQGNIIDGARRPSTETPMHTAIYKGRADVMGICHTHSTYSTAWASCCMDLPVAVEQLADIVGSSVKCTSFKRGGTLDLAEEVVRVLKDKYVVLLANHGLLTVGETLEDAFNNAIIVENTAKITCLAKVLGEIKWLEEEELVVLRNNAKQNYGQ
jgi:L-ribulose-5-phosphate 4-epimerase